MSTAIGRAIQTKPDAAAGVATSPVLEWVWKYLRDVRHPHILDCGPFRASTAEVLLRRGTKLYVTDLVTPLLTGAPQFWDRSRKKPVFKVESLLAQLPKIPPASLSLVLCWQLLDLVPHEALDAVILRLHALLEPRGVFVCILREAYLRSGVEFVWRLETLSTVRREREGIKPFPYPAISSRQMERLLPTDNLKSFLTRSGFRETLAIK